MSLLRPRIIKTILRSIANQTYCCHFRYLNSDPKFQVVRKGDIPKLVKSEPDGTDSQPVSGRNYYDREFEDMKLEDFSELYESDKTGKTKELIRTILADYESMKFNTLGRVPSSLSVSAMARLIDADDNVSARENTLNYLFKREMAKLADTRRKLKKREIKALQEMEKSSDTHRTGLIGQDGELLYGLWHNSLFCRIRESDMRSVAASSRLKEAAMFGRKLIFDFGYGEYMTEVLYMNVLEQLRAAIGLNQYNYREPFDIWYCNLKKGGFEENYTKRSTSNDIFRRSWITIKEDCFTNHFDRSQLVYLSPHSKEPLKQDISKTDDIYIIGVFNDKGNSLPLSLRKAEMLGIRARKLPLDNYLAWSSSSKNLCINHVTGILLEVVSNGGDWRAAFHKHIPPRKIKKVETVIEEEERRKRKRFLFDIRDDLEW